MDKKDERILHRAEKAGVKLAKKQGHMPTRDELLELKIQVIPNPIRWICFGTSVICAIGAWLLFGQDNNVWASVLAVTSVLLLAFSIFGIRRTLETLADHASYDLVESVFGLIGDAVGSILD